MRYLSLLLVVVLAAVGCESDTPDYSTFARVLSVDVSHLGYDSSVKVIVFAPIRPDVLVRVDTTSKLHDSLVAYCYAHALVGDSMYYNMRKPTYTLADTLHFYYEGVVDSLGEAPTNHALPDQFRPDSLLVYLPSTRTPAVVIRPN